MGIFDKLKEQALNGFSELTGNSPESVKGGQNPQRNPVTPPVTSGQTSSTSKHIYNEQLENLIEIALADGELTEKEKQVLFKKAEAQGIDLDEFEMVLDAKLYEKQKAMSSEKPVSNQSAPKSEKYGDIRKCPACGAIVESFSTRCQDCGYEFTNVESTTSVKLFFKKMEEIESNRSNSLISGITTMYGLDKTVRQKETLISSFPIPNTKEDILEFLTIAVPQAKDTGFFQAMRGSVTQEQMALKAVWKRKCEQIILKARLSMKDDKVALEQIEKFAKELKIK